METQTRFDITAAIADWQLELAQQPGLTPIVQRELETHLRDTVAELQSRGLNNEESFWLARRRVGSPDQLGREFAKADPAKLWRERVFWAVLALLGVDLWQRTIAGFIGLLEHAGIYKNPTRLTALSVYLLLIWLPVVLIAVRIAKGGFDLSGRRWRALLQSRVCVAAITTASLLFCSTVTGLLLWNPLNHSLINVLDSLSWQLPWPSLLLGLSLWLMPRKILPGSPREQVQS